MDLRVCIRASAMVLVLLITAAIGQQVPETLYNGLQWRNVGPFRGGRVVAVAGVPQDANTYYFGSVNGGIWKTTDAGVVWKPVSDAMPVGAIGALAVAQSEPNVVYAGTGEADIRSDLSQGAGVYKSSDAGKSWRFIGLKETRQIGRIVVSPRDSNVVYVAALGHAYGPNPERGVYGSTDGGEHWQKLLDKGPDVGAVDLALDEENPNVIYATMWQARRPPWSTYAPLQGPGSGLYKSSDAGKTWAQLQGNGLPSSEWHRSGVAVLPGGKRVYALVDAAKDAGLYRSDDAGATWSRVSSDPRITSRGWYFGTITVDPKNPDLVYVPNVATYWSNDGGKTFTVLRGAPGGDDYHILWVNPNDPKSMVLGTDQGTTVSRDGGATWSTWYNQPTAQLYHVSADNALHYNLYGAQQDSGTAATPSSTDHGEITNRDFFSVGGSESGYIVVDPQDANIIYSSGTYGSVDRFDRRTSAGHDITPWPSSNFGTTIAERKLRAPWTPPLVMSPVDPTALYFAAQYLFVTHDGGLNWKQISPDLTGDARNGAPAKGATPTVETAKELGYGTIYSVAPSPQDGQEIWVGSDTGLVHLTRDGGAHWQNVTPPALSDWSKITSMEASHVKAGTAYAAVDRHRLEDNKPYIYRTTDWGKTWKLIVKGIGDGAFVNAVREDPSSKLMFAATELGVYVSFNAGDDWHSLQLNLPMTSVRDIVIHKNDAIIATHGRGFWVLDGINALRQADAQVASADAWLYAPADAVRTTSDFFQGTPLPLDLPRAKNPAQGAYIDYVLKQDAPDLALDILDGKGAVIRHYPESKPAPDANKLAIAPAWMPEPQKLETIAGMHRLVWDLRYPAATQEAFAPAGPQVLPGTYSVRLRANGKSLTRSVKVLADPRITTTPADLQAKFEVEMAAWNSLEQANAAQTEMADGRKKAQAAGDSAREKQIAKLLGESDEEAGIATGIKQVSAQISTVLASAESADRRPTSQAQQALKQAQAELQQVLAAWNRLRGR
jgi:photosystem II stability/assembly factor-like uncharacterized protein